MVGKLSDDTKMSGSRIPVLYCWKHGVEHPFSTPNDELRKSLEAKAGTLRDFDIGEPGIVGNLLEPALVTNACEELGLPGPELTPPVFKLSEFECSCDGLVELPEPVTVRSGGIVTISGDAESIELSGRLPIECKCTAAPPSDRVPLYRGPVQLQAQMMATGATAGIIVTLHRGIERRIHVVAADYAMQQEIADICSDFRRRVECEEWYPPVTVADAAIPPASTDSEPVDLSSLENDIYQLEIMRNDREVIDADIEALELRIMSRMGDATTGVAGPYTVQWPTRHYKAQPERVVAAKEARTIRLKTLKIRSNV